MPPELTIIAVTALLAGLLLVGIMLAGRRTGAGDESRALASVSPRAESAEADPTRDRHARGGEASGAGECPPPRIG